MKDDELYDALGLCRQVSKDLKELAKLWTHRCMEDVHAGSEFTRRMGGDHGRVLERLGVLERNFFKGDLESIANGEWPVYDLVNYYDAVIDKLQCRHKSAGGKGGEAEALLGWRTTAGRLAQVVCRIEDG